MIRAWRVHEHGAPLDALRLDEVEAPVPGPGEVAIDVTACALNFADSLLCQGTYQEKPPLPFTPGMEVAGVIAAVGDGVDTARIGARVVALPSTPNGGLAERCVAHTDAAWPTPDGIDDVIAASLPIAYGTASVGLFHRAALLPGETVLVHAAAGGTGSAALQLAVAHGAVAYATAGSPDKVAICRKLGAIEAWDSRADGFDLVGAVRAVTADRGVDVVFDPVGGDLFDASRRVVAFEGRYLVIGFASGTIPSAPLNHALVKNYSLIGVHWGAYRKHDPAVVAAAQASVLDALAAGRIDPLIGAVRPLDEAAAALDDVAAGRTTGKVVITTR